MVDGSVDAILVMERGGEEGKQSERFGLVMERSLDRTRYVIAVDTVRY